jgi:inhibitor of cysteine peptidase
MRSAKILLSSLLVLVLCGWTITAGQEAKKTEKVVIMEEKAGKEVSVRKGDTVLVKLPVTGGTGYTWVIAENKKEVLEPVGKPTTEAIKGEKPRPGGKRLLVLTFQAKAAGKSKLELEYKRPFEKGKKAAKAFAVTVVVK